MAAENESGDGDDVGMPQPEITPELSIDELCAVLGDEAHREAIEEIAMRGWVAVDDLDVSSGVLENHGVIDVRGKTAERGVNFASALSALNALVLSQGAE